MRPEGSRVIEKPLSLPFPPAALLSVHDPPGAEGGIEGTVREISPDDHVYTSQAPTSPTLPVTRMRPEGSTVMELPAVIVVPACSIVMGHDPPGAEVE